MRRRRLAVSAIPGMALAMILSGSAVALSWEAPVTISSSGFVSSRNTLSVTGSSSAVAAVEAPNPTNWNGYARGVYVRRTTDGGKTWLTRQLVSRDPADIAEKCTGYPTCSYTAGRPQLAGSGSHLALTYQEQWDLTPYYGAVLLLSDDGGKTWHWCGECGTGDDIRPMGPAVARSGSRVASAWTDGDTGAIRVRVSTDGGDLFGPSVTIGQTTAAPWAGRWDPFLFGTHAHDGDVAVAFGDGVVYVVWNTGTGKIVVRRSTDGGKTWRSPQTLTSTAGDAAPSVAGVSTHAVVAFVSDSGYVAIRRTSDSGATWKARQNLWASSPRATSLVLARTGSTWFVAYQRCLTSSCESTAVYIRRGTSYGATWSTVTRVSQSWSGQVAPAGVGLLGTHVLIEYAAHNPSTAKVFSRRGT